MKTLVSLKIHERYACFFTTEINYSPSQTLLGSSRNAQRKSVAWGEALRGDEALRDDPNNGL